MTGAGELWAAGLEREGRRGICGSCCGVRALKKKGRVGIAMKRGSMCGTWGWVGSVRGLGSCGGSAVCSEHCWGHSPLRRWG